MAQRGFRVWVLGFQGCRFGGVFDLGHLDFGDFRLGDLGLLFSYHEVEEGLGKCGVEGYL